jgi:hypothetical protein
MKAFDKSIPRGPTENRDAEEFAKGMEALRRAAQDLLKVSQAFQERSYNRGRLDFEFKEGNKVLINPHSMNLLRATTGKGKKLLPKYDGPFKILSKLSPVTYRLRLPALYKIHPVINIAHLQLYHELPEEFGTRSKKHFNREDLEELPEYKRILDEKWENLPARKGRKAHQVKHYLTCFIGFGAEWDEWLSAQDMRNAPMILQEWRDSIHTKKQERVMDSMAGEEEARHKPCDEEPLKVNRHKGQTNEAGGGLPIHSNDANHGSRGVRSSERQQSRK